MKKIIDAYGEALIELGKQRNDIIVLSADSKLTKQFAKEHPNKFIQCGKTEQNILGIAKGLAMDGKIPFASTCSAIGKVWDQLREICHNNLNVKIVDAHEKTTEDIALARILPNITIIVPTDYYEAKKAALAAGIMKGPVFLRLGTEKTHTTNEKTPFTIGRVEIMRAGKDCTIIASGPILSEALQAAEKLSKQEIECTVLNCHTIKPIDKHAVITSARLTGCVITAEEHETGGLGSAVAEILGQNAPVPIRMISAGPDTIMRITKAAKDAALQRCETTCTTIPEEHGKFLYTELQPELYFRLHGGGIIKSIPGLQKALLEMNNETFSHHRNNQKNDFSNWIKDVFKEPALAKQLEKAHTKIGMALTLARWMI